MKQWIKNLLSDAKGLPSTRLHLAWGLFITLNIALFVGANDTTIGLILGSMTTLAGISVIDKGGENETNNTGRPQGEN